MGEIRFVGTGETRGYPYLVCKKEKSQTSVERDILVPWVKKFCFTVSIVLISNLHG